MDAIGYIYRTAFLICLGLNQALMAQAEAKTTQKQANLDNLFYSNVGIDHSMLTLSMGYGRYLEDEILQRRILIFADYGMPLAKPNIRNFRLRLGFSAATFEFDVFRLPIWLSLNVLGSNNNLFQAVGLGSELGIAPGYYGKLFEIAPELYWNQTWVAHMNHSDWYRAYFYEHAKNGWYGMGASSIRAGFHFAWNINPHFLAGLKGGYERHGQYNVLIPPVYLSLHMGFRF